MATRKRKNRKKASIRRLNGSKIKRSGNKKYYAKKKKTGLMKLLSFRYRRMYMVIFVVIFAFFTLKIINNVQYNSVNESQYNNISRDDFINTIEDAAVKQYKKTGVLPSIMLAQAILESNWGESQLSIKGNNLFGIKADKSWKGPTIRFQTKENYNDTIKADFRKYKSWDESIKDHGKFLKENKRYRENGMFETTSYKVQAQALEDASYSTKLNEKGEKVYADYLINIIEKYKLYKYDHIALGY